MTYTSFNSTYNPTFTVYNIPEADITKICAIEVTGFQFVSTISSKFARAELPTPKLTITNIVEDAPYYDVTYTAENFTNGAALVVLKYSGSNTPAAFEDTEWDIDTDMNKIEYYSEDFTEPASGDPDYTYSSGYSTAFNATNGTTFTVQDMNENDITKICLIEATGNATTTESNFAQATVPPAPTASIASTSVTNGGSVCSGTIVTLTASAENLGATTPSYVWEKKNSDETYTPVTGASGTNNEELILYSLSTPGTYTYHVKATADGTFSADYTFTIKPIYTPSDVTVTISGPTGTDLNNVPTNSSVLLTATVTPEALQNSVASYAWYNGGLLVGDDAATYTYAAGSTATTSNITCKVMFNYTICKNESLGYNGKTSAVKAITVVPAATPTLTVTGKTANAANASNWDVTFTPENFTENAKVAVLKYTGTGTPAAFAYTNWGLTQSLKNYAATDFYVVWPGSDYSSVYSRYFLITSGVTFKVTGLAEADITKICLIEATGNATTTSSKFAQATAPATPTASIAPTGVTSGGSVCGTETVTLTASVENGTATAWAWEKLSGADHVAVTTDDGTANGATFTPSTAAAGTYTYRAVALVGGTECPSDGFTFTVKPIATVAANEFALSATINNGATTLTSGETVTNGTIISFAVADPTSVGVANPVSYFWYIGTEQIPGDGISTFGFSKPTAGEATIRVKFTPTAATGYCGTFSEIERSFTVTFVDPITASIAPTGVTSGGSVCGTETVTLTASVENGTATAWAWEKRSGDNFVAVTSTDGTADGATFTPNLATAGTYTYRATATVDGTEYPSAGFEFTVTANMPDIDAATPSSGNSMCAADDGMFITATDAPANGTNTYTWYKAVATVCPAETSPEWGESIFTSSTDRNYNISANELEAGNTYWFKVVATNTNYCGESVAYAPVIVKPAMPTLTLASDDYTSGEAVCAGTAGVITANFASTLTGTTEYSVEKSETETGEYEPFNYYGVVNTATGTMTFPQGALLADATGYYKVTATNPNYCGTAEAIFHLIVTPGLDQPEITATVGGAALNNEGTTCANNEITFTAKKVTGATYVEGTTFVWEYGTTENGITTWTAITGVSGKTASWTPTETGTYTLRVTASKESSCPTTSEVFEYTVNPVYSSNDVTVTIAAPAGTDLTNVIAGSTVTFTATVDAAGLDNDDFTFQWYKNGSAVAGVNGVTYDYPANLGEGHFGYVYCVATLNATGICQNANWNGIRGSNTATIIKIPDPNAIGSLGSLNASGITKYTAKLNWTKTNASDNVVVYLKQEATAGTPTLPTADGAPTANPVFNKNIANNIQVVYAGPATSVSISGLAKKTQYTAYAYICNADFAAASFSATNMRDTTFKTKSFKEAYEITDPDFEGEFSVSTVAPNPVTGDELNFNIQSINNANYEIELFSSNGEYITGMTQMLSEGIHSMKLDLNSQKGGLSTGAYILRVRSDGHTLSQPVRIVR